jgi:uncharacterized membrane protein YhaH (DUF805 family)
MKNYYKLLNLESSAISDEIQSAFDLLDQQFNPAKNHGDTMFESTYLDVKEAYEVLIDPVSRKKYDKSINVNQPTAKIIQFNADTDSFENGDTIRIEWSTENAVKVEINLFGQVELSGTKIFRPKNSADDLKLEIFAWTANNDQPISQTLFLSFIQELDMGDSDLLKSEESTEMDEERELVELKENFSQKDPEVNSEIADSGNSNYRKDEFEEEKFFSAFGRIRRSTYLVRGLLLAIPAFILYYFIYESTLYYVDVSAVLIFSILGLIAVGVLNMIQFIKRLHDVGQSGWLSLLTLIPYLGGIFGLMIMCIDSEKGTNKYGPNPKERTKPVKSQA